MAKRKLKDALAMMPSRPNQGANATFRTRPPRATSSVSPTGGQAPKPQPVTGARKRGLKAVKVSDEMRRTRENTTTNPRAGQGFDEVKRAGREFHVYYGDGGKRQVFEVHRPTVSGKKPQKTTPGIQSGGARNGALGSRSALASAAAAAMAQQTTPRSAVGSARNRRRRTSSFR